MIKKRPGDLFNNVIFLSGFRFVIPLYCCKRVLQLSAVSLLKDNRLTLIR